MHSGNSQVLGLGGGVLGGKHGSVRGSLIAISLHLHASGDSGKGLTAGKVGDVLVKKTTLQLGPRDLHIQ
jgi:hypothetical protein